MLEEEEGLLHEDRHLITNCIGSASMRIEIGPPIEMASRDTLVIGSDGLFDNLIQGEIVEQIRKGDLLSQMSELVNIASTRMVSPDAEPSKPDDLTVLCFRQQA